MLLPDKQKDLARWAMEIVANCRSSQSMRAPAYRQYAQWVETGRQQGGLALANMLYSHIDRLHSHLFSPSELRFSIDAENQYGDKEYAMMKMGGRILSREWERENIDMTFAEGVRESLVYGAIPIKLLAKGNGISRPELSSQLVMPWNFGVYNETQTDITKQEAVVETAFLTKPEVWRRVSHLPEAEKLFERITAGSDKQGGDGSQTSFFHQVLSTMALDTTGASATSQLPGGIVQLANGPTSQAMGPQIGVDIFPMHELWVKDDDLNDYVTIQIFEPDILVAPQFARKNLLCPSALPYRLICPNQTANYFWGRSELVDLMQLQQLLSTTLDDIRRIMGNQFDKLLFFAGDGLNDETYGQFRSQGWGNLGPNGKVQDMTPQLPQGSFDFVNMITGFMEKLGGFSNILSGQGEYGVRAGNHADMLMKTASPRLRDRSLMLERQCASFADLTFTVKASKDATVYWTDEDRTEAGEFLLKQIPEDRRITVDSHSSSPIYQDDHMDQLLIGLKVGAVGGDTFIEQSNLPNKDILLERYKVMEAAKAAAAQQEQALELKELEIKHPATKAAAQGPQAA